MKEFAFYTCDVFTDRCFSGNQLAVIPDAENLTAKEMQSIAAEFNYSETTFVLPSKDPKCSFRVRIFTPRHELPFAGHPVLGTAFILAGRGTLKPEGSTIRTAFELEIGSLSVTVKFADEGLSFMRFTLPEPAVPEKTRLSDSEIASALDLAESDIGFGSYKPAAGFSGVKMLLVPLKNSEALEKARVNAEQWNDIISKNDIRAVYMFTEKTGEELRDSADVLSGASGERKPNYSARMFAPELGVPEDPATGSAAAFLASYLSVYDPEIAEKKNGKVSRIIEQGVRMKRPSELAIQIHKTDGLTGIQVGGRAVLVSCGSMFI